MAKQATAQNTEVAPQQKAVVQAKKVPTFEFKDRNYYISTGKSPLVYSIPSKHLSLIHI